MESIPNIKIPSCRRSRNENTKGKFDDFSFFRTPNGSFWDVDGEYFNRYGFDIHGGCYKDNIDYIPGPGWIPELGCYPDEKEKYMEEDNFDDVEENEEDNYIDDNKEYDDKYNEYENKKNEFDDKDIDDAINKVNIMKISDTNKEKDNINININKKSCKKKNENKNKNKNTISCKNNKKDKKDENDENNEEWEEVED